MIKILNDNSFEEFISESQNRVVVDFYAEWCGPCKMMAPVFENLSEKYPNIEFAKVNVDESMNVSAKYGIMSIPTFIIFENGKPIKKQLGAMSELDFENFIN